MPNKKDQEVLDKMITAMKELQKANYYSKWISDLYYCHGYFEVRLEQVTNNV